MKLNLLKLFCLTAIVYFFSSCGTAGPGPDTSGDLTSGIYVSQLRGNDTNTTGKKNNPYKTITYALSKTKTGIFNKIYINRGVYSQENGEIFPLILPKEVKIYKLDDNDSDNDVYINGFGNFDDKYPVAIVFQGNNKIQNVTINSNKNIGILSSSNNNQITSCNIINNLVGISTIESADITIKDTLITGNTHGIEASGYSTINLIQSVIYKNDVGIRIDDLAEINLNSFGQSVSKITENIKCDFLQKGDKNLDLTGIKWDDNTLDFAIEKVCVNGNNIVNSGLGIINYVYSPIDVMNEDDITHVTINDNNIVNNSPIDVMNEDNITNIVNNSPIDVMNEDDITHVTINDNKVLFKNSKLINITSPTFNERVYTNTPYIKYENTKNDKHIMIVIWKNMPKVIDKTIRIDNSSDIVWFWHTGMQNGFNGYVEYNSGSTPINGNINPSNTNYNPAKPLINGKPYYLTIWEWDDKGINIVSSSNISYFSVAP